MTRLSQQLHHNGAAPEIVAAAEMLEGYNKRLQNSAPKSLVEYMMRMIQRDRYLTGKFRDVNLSSRSFDIFVLYNSNDLYATSAYPDDDCRISHNRLGNPRRRSIRPGVDPAINALRELYPNGVPSTKAVPLAQITELVNEHVAKVRQHKLRKIVDISKHSVRRAIKELASERFK